MKHPRPTIVGQPEQKAKRRIPGLSLTSLLLYCNVWTLTKKMVHEKKCDHSGEEKHDYSRSEHSLIN